MKDFSFELRDTIRPDIVIQNELKILAEITKGYVTGNVLPYDGPVHSYVKYTPSLASAFSSVLGQKDLGIDVDIQQDLGEQGTEEHKFEVFLSVKGLDLYKYRLMFVEYKTISYPVLLILDRKIAEEYNKEKVKTFYNIPSMAILSKMIQDILSLDFIQELIQSLINEAIRTEISKELP